MYQVKCSNGYEIQVIGKGENGLCRVMDQHKRQQFSGTYAACVEWLNYRTVRVIG